MFTVKRNTHGLEIEEYSTIVPNKDSLSFLEDELRIRKNHFLEEDNVIMLLDYRVTEMPTLCSSGYNLQAITERIPKRLTEI